MFFLCVCGAALALLAYNNNIGIGIIIINNNQKINGTYDKIIGPNNLTPRAHL